MSYYWSAESWGSDYPPADWESVVENANEIIDAYAETYPDRDLNEFSERLWERYCTDGELPYKKIAIL